MIIIDGSTGEGGGQIVRTSLTLSLLTGHPVRIVNIRANRSSPGLKAQHLTAGQAAAEISGARVKGNRLDSQEVLFYPGDVQGGKYQFQIQTAGSACLVLQTIFIPLAQADRSSQIEIMGGTHVPWSPSFHYLDRQWLPYLQKMGYGGKLELEKAGYFPRGGGKLKAFIDPARGEQPLEVTERGKLNHISGLSLVSNLPVQIAHRQRDRVVGLLGSRFPLNDIRITQLPAVGKGTMIFLKLEFEHSQACFFSLGEKGKRAETVAEEGAQEVIDFMQTEGVVDRYLADQILLPLCLSGKKSVLRVPRISSHLMTNAEIIQRFLNCSIILEGSKGREGILTVEAA